MSDIDTIEKDSNGFIIMFDLYDEKSFEWAKDYYEKLKNSEKLLEMKNIVFVGNKKENEEIKKKNPNISTFFKDKQLKYFECDIKKENVDNIFNYLYESIVNNVRKAKKGEEGKNNYYSIIKF